MSGKNEQPPSANLVRAGKADGHNPAMHEHGKSDRPIRLAKLPNKVGQPRAQAVEERGLTKENADQRNAPQTQSWNHGAPNGPDRVRQAALRYKKERFSSLSRHITIELLRDAFFSIKKNATPGVDGVGARGLKSHRRRREIERCYILILREDSSGYLCCIG